MVRLIFIIAILFPVLSQAQVCGKVVGVHDGDTFTLLAEGNRTVKVRLHGIDCPELGQAFGRNAKQRASELIFGKTLCVDSTARDRYGRMIAIVPLGGDSTLNTVLIHDGLAWHYKKYDKNAAWADMEIDARKHKRGLWKDSAPIAPWEYR